jgi:hypothetical protein
MCLPQRIQRRTDHGACPDAAKTASHFRTPDVLRFLGRPRQPAQVEVTTRMQRRSEGVRVKHWWLLSDLSGDRARPGATLVPLREGIADLPRRVTLAQAINARYLDALSVMAQPTPVHLLRDPVSRPRLVNGRRYRALRPITADESRCFQRLLDGRTLLDGIPGRVTCAPC